MHPSSFLAPAALVFAVSAALSAPVAAQTTKAKPPPQAELYLDVATHSMPGMAGAGAIGRFAGVMGGGNASYGMARHPGMPGKYLDVALHNRVRPGASAYQAIPDGLRLGKRIELLPPEPRKAHDGAADGSTDAQGLADGGPYTIRYYWGCGEQVRAGQPSEYTVSIRDGKPVQGGRAMPPRQVPQHTIEPGPQHALWPNPSHRKSVPAKASLIGTHHLTGSGLPEAMQFELGPGHDFLPELKLDSEGDVAQGMTLRWNDVDGARAYFIHATAMDGNTIVMWSSAEDGYAGPELIDFLPESTVAQWAGKRTLLDAGTRSCRVPQAVFAGSGGKPMVQMIAYGNERSIDRQDWRVRVRSKSTAMLMPGAGSAKDAAKPAAKEAAKGVLRGLFGR